MQFTSYSFGLVRVDGVTYNHDLIIDHGTYPQAQEGRLPEVPRRVRAHAALCRGGYPVAMPPAGPIGTGAEGALPVMQQVRDEARRRKVDLVVLPTAQAIGVLAEARAHTNAILHLTC